jgi:general secretion pathway protein A
MYEKFYGLKEKPFQIVPNPSYLYMSPTHENALTYLEYGLMENVGFILLTGDVGTGKTTLVRYIMNQFETEKDIAVIFNTDVSTDELVYLILQAFDLEPEQVSKARNLEIFYQFLIKKYAENKQVLLIIDEAQNLSDEALEGVRMLSNLQSDDQNLIQIMLVGQPELKNRLQQPGHNPFAQRIAVNFFLSGLAENETQSYITYRLEKAGGRPDIFNPEAIDMIFKASGGIPRTINLLCDAALVYGFGYELETIDTTVVEQVIKDKGGMGLSAGRDNKKGPFTYYYDQDLGEADWEKLVRLDDTVRSLQQKVHTLMDMVEGLEEKTGDFTENIDRKLEKLLDFERKRNDTLMVAYARLKAKYDNLLKTRETNLSKLEKMVKVKFVKDELEKWLQHIRKNAKS